MIIESASKLLNIPVVNKNKLLGKEYGLVKVNFVKNYGTLSNYNIPWKQLNLKQIDYDEFTQEIVHLENNVYVLVDSSKTPIYKCLKESLNLLLNEEMKPFDVDIYIFDESFKKCIIYTGLFDKKIYKLLS